MIKLFFLMFLVLNGYTKEIFTPEMIFLYLDDTNPNFYKNIGEQKVSKSKELIYEGAFDYKLEGNYDKKEYGASKGVLEQIHLKKSMGNGVEFSLGYRKSEGTQEYNNIKTGKDGELISSIKMPLNSMVYNINKNELNLKNAKLTTKTIYQKQRKNLLSLYLNIVKIYYKVLLQKEILTTERELLSKAKRNLDFISKAIKEGNLPEIASFEIQEQIIDRELRVTQANNSFNRVKNILMSYLNISNEDFDTLYEFGRISRDTLKIKTYKEALKISLKNRPEFQELDTIVKKNKIAQTYTQTKKYPKFDVKMYANYDFKYKEGYKVSFNLNFPLQRSSYKGEKQSLQKELLLLKSKKDVVKLEITLRIKNIFQQIEMQEKVIALSKKQLKLTLKLEEVERKKYFHGVGNLMFINQREINTLKVKQKQSTYYYQLQLLHETLTYYLAQNY